MSSVTLSVLLGAGLDTEAGGGLVGGGVCSCHPPHGSAGEALNSSEFSCVRLSAGHGTGSPYTMSQLTIVSLRHGGGGWVTCLHK